jgi:putative hydrolase of the HAD superfamily
MKAIIFDFDGTIVDTEALEILAWKSTLEKHNLSIPDEQWHDNIGKDSKLFDPITELENKTGQKLNRKLITSQRSEQISALHANLEPQPGVAALLKAAHDSGLKLIVASNSSRDWITKILGELKLLEFFDFIVSREDVKALKPDPEIYLLALKKLNLQAYEAIVIEDSPVGTKAAIAAGINCLVVPNRLSAHLNYPETFYRANNLAEVTLTSIAEKLIALLHTQG